MKLRPRGYVLALVFGIIFFLVTIVAVLHHQQVTARRTYTRAAADLQFEQGRRFAVAQTLGVKVPTSTADIAVWGDVQPSSATDPLVQAAGKLWEKLPDVAVDEESEEMRANLELSIQPKTYDSTLKVFGDRTFQVVARAGDSYAAYAPKGNIQIASEVVGWANPTFKHSEDDAEKASSGVHAILYAGKEITTGKLVYGSAYSPEGPLELGKGRAVGFIGPGPKRSYAASLNRKLEQAQSSLDSIARQNGEKTASIKGGVFDRVSKVAELFDSDSNIADTFTPTLQEAMAFNMPIIPGFTKHPPFILEVWFNVPFVSDFADFGDPVELDDPEDKKDREELKRLQTQFDAAEAEVTRLKAELRKATSDDKRDEIQDELDDAESDRDKKSKKLKNAGDDYQDKLKKNTKNVGDNIPSQPAAPPTTRREDLPRKKNRNGTPGHNYSGLFSNMLQLLLGDRDILDTLAPKVRVVHFGRMDNNADDNFDFSNPNETITAVTWTVPRGRCFRFTGDLVVTGDIWVQRGAIFAVDGDLTLQNPKVSAANPLAPKGRLHLEEGATLIVDGNFTAAGNLGYGSVQVGGLPGQIHPITSAILCTGNVTLPYGSYSATTLDDLARWIGEETGAQALVKAADMITPVFANVAPNLAKIAGPFHMRKVYFAQFASTFVLASVPTPIGPVPVPFPTFLPRKNALIPVFKGLTYMYTPMMNWTLGENLYTHADWWFFGDGAVPMFPKIDPIRAAKGLAGLNLSGVSLDIDWKKELEKQAENVLKKVVEKVFVDIIRKIGLKIAASAIPYGGAIIVDTLLDEIFAALELEEKTLGDLMTELAKDALEPFERAVKSVLDQLSDQLKDGINDGLLRELSGVLIFADTIDVGYKDGSPSTQALLTSGMFVAKHDIRMNCESTVGTVTSLEGNIELNKLFYVPYFSRASLYKPKALTGTDFISRGTNILYGKAFNSSLFQDVDTDIRDVVAEGWNR